LFILTKVTLAISNNALPDDGDTPKHIGAILMSILTL